MRYQAATLSNSVEKQIREAFKRCESGEMCLTGAIRLMYRGNGHLPQIIFLSETELLSLEENGYNRDSDPFILENAVLLVLEASKNDQIRTRGIYGQGDLFELQR